MNKQQIVEWFYTNSTNLTGARIAVIMLAALCIAMAIFWTYKLTYRGVAYNQRFNVTNVIILLICVVMMLMISSNIVISLGMVGALSVVRFRTAVKDSRDTAYIFWSLVEGLCVGSQNFKLAIISTLFIAIVLFAFQFVSLNSKKYLVIVHGNGEVKQSDVENVFFTYSKHIDLRTVNCTDGHQEMIFELRTKNKLDNEFSDKLMKIQGITSVNWLVESADTIG